MIDQRKLNRLRASKAKFQKRKRALKNAVQICTCGRIAQGPSRKVHLVPNRRVENSFLLGGENVYGCQWPNPHFKKKSEKANHVLLGMMT